MRSSIQSFAEPWTIFASSKTLRSVSASDVEKRANMFSGFWSMYAPPNQFIRTTSVTPGELRDLRHVGLGIQFVSETLCRTMSRNIPLPPVGSPSSVRRSVPMMQITRSGRTIDAIVRSERVFLRKRFLKTNGRNFISPPASGRP